MVLATRCPHCHTTFRVVHDQLKLRAGLVRCGACKEIFNGVENLLAPPPAADATSPAADTQAPPPEAQASASQETEAAQASADGADQAEPASPEEPGATGDQPAQPTQAAAQDRTAENAPQPTPEYSAPASADPLLRMTLLDIAQEGPPRAAPAADQPPEKDDIAQAIDDLHNKPWRGTRDYSLPIQADAIDALDEDEPEFVTLARHRKRLARRVRMFLIFGSALLAVTLSFQALIQFRNQISASLPAAIPALEALCGVADCQLGLPMQIQHLTIESSELQALPNDGQAFTLAILLRNRSSLQQAWPHLQLTLNDAQEQPLVRRILAPADYLPARIDTAGGFPAQSEQAARIRFTLSDTQASGYRLYLFYP